MRRAAVFVAGLVGVCASANAQPGSLPATALEDFPHVQISNGLITAQVYPPGEKQLYRGTRFDHAGVVFHVTYKGQDFSTYWFDRFLTDPLRAVPGTSMGYAGVPDAKERADLISYLAQAGRSAACKR